MYNFWYITVQKVSKVPTLELNKSKRVRGLEVVQCLSLSLGASTASGSRRFPSVYLYVSCRAHVVARRHFKTSHTHINRARNRDNFVNSEGQKVTKLVKCEIY